MTAELTPQQIQDELGTMLGGIDHSTPLNSLHTVAVMSYLGNRGFPVSFTSIADHPQTLEGWVEWAGRHSSAS